MKKPTKRLDYRQAYKLMEGKDLSGQPKVFDIKFVQLNGRVVILQFLKDGSSGEIEMLRRCGAAVYACPNAKFTWLMTDAERAEARRTNTRTLQTILQGSFDLLVLDEACAACKNDLVEEALLREAAARAEQGAEVVLTGREPAAWMQDAADYSTELRAVKHPYTRGIAAREGVEY